MVAFTDGCIKRTPQAPAASARKMMAISTKRPFFKEPLDAAHAAGRDPFLAIRCSRGPVLQLVLLPCSSSLSIRAV